MASIIERGEPYLVRLNLQEDRNPYMKIILRILLALTISLSIIVLQRSANLAERISISGDRLNPLPPISQALKDKTYPIDDGFIDRTGIIVLKLPPNTGSPHEFSEGLAAISMPNLSDDSNSSLGYIDRTGKIVISPRFTDRSELEGANNFSEGLAAFNSSANVDSQGRYLYGYIDRSGKVVIPARFAKAGSFVDGRAFVEIFTKDSVRFAFIDKQGKIIFEHLEAYEVYSFSEGLAAVRIDEKWGFIDRTGKFIIPPQFVNIPMYSGFREGLAPVRTWDKIKCKYGYGFIDRTGKFIIEPKFQDARVFAEGLAAVSIIEDNQLKWGYIDRRGKSVIQPQFVETTFGVQDFHEGLASVNIPDPESVNGKSGYIDRTGNFIIPPQFTQGTQSFNGGLTWVETDLKPMNLQQFNNVMSGGSSPSSSGIKRGYIDRTGKFVWSKTDK